MPRRAGADGGQDRLTTLQLALSITPSLNLSGAYSILHQCSWLSRDSCLFREMMQGNVVEEKTWGLRSGIPGFKSQLYLLLAV